MIINHNIDNLIPIIAKKTEIDPEKVKLAYKWAWRNMKKNMNTLNNGCVYVNGLGEFRARPLYVVRRIAYIDYKLNKDETREIYNRKSFKIEYWDAIRQKLVDLFHLIQEQKKKLPVWYLKNKDKMKTLDQYLQENRDGKKKKE